MDWNNFERWIDGLVRSKIEKRIRQVEPYEIPETVKREIYNYVERHKDENFSVIQKVVEEEVKIYFKASIQGLIEKEIEKQLTNRNIASKGYVKTTIVEMTSDRINSLQKQINKLFANMLRIRKKEMTYEEGLKELDKIQEAESIIKFHKNKVQEQLKLFKDF